MSGYCSDVWYALVHTPIPIKQAFRIPNARKAVDKQLEKMTKTGAWDFRTFINREKM